MIVVDTHALIWWSYGDKNSISRSASSVLAVRAAELRDSLRDPADCMIAATAIVHRAPLVTKDDRIRASGLVETIW